MSSNSGIRRWYSSTSKRKFLIAQDAFTGIGITSVTNSTGSALFTTSFSVLPYTTGDAVLLQSFAAYLNTTYYFAAISSTTFNLYSSRIGAINRNPAQLVAFAGNDTGTVTLQS